MYLERLQIQLDVVRDRTQDCMVR